MYIAIATFVLVVLFLCFFSETITNNYNKVKTLCTIYKNFKDPNTIEDKSDVILEQNHIKINYNYNNKQHIVNLPFKSSIIFPMLDSEVIAEYKDRKVDITQQAGIPYFVTANDLECERIIMKNLDTGEMKIFTGEEQIDIDDD